MCKFVWFGLTVTGHLLVSISLWMLFAFVISFIACLVAQIITCWTLYQSSTKFAYSKILMYFPLGLLAFGAMINLHLIYRFARYLFGSFFSFVHGIPARLQIFLTLLFFFVVLALIEMFAGLPFCLFWFLDNARMNQLETIVYQNLLSHENWKTIREQTILPTTIKTFASGWKYAFSRIVSEITTPLYLFLTLLFINPIIRSDLLSNGYVSWVLPNFYVVLFDLNLQTYTYHVLLTHSLLCYLSLVPIICVITGCLGYGLVQIILSLENSERFERFLRTISQWTMKINGQSLYFAYARMIDVLCLGIFIGLVMRLTKMCSIHEVIAISFHSLLPLFLIVPISFVLINFGVLYSIRILGQSSDWTHKLLRASSNFILSTPSPTWSIFLSFFVILPLVSIATENQMIFLFGWLNVVWILLIATLIGSAIGILNFQNFLQIPDIEERIKLYEKLQISRSEIYRNFLQTQIIDNLLNSNLVMVGRFLETILGVNFVLMLIMQMFLESINHFGNYPGTHKILSSINVYCLQSIEGWVIVASILALIFLAFSILTYFSKTKKITKSIWTQVHSGMTYILVRVL